MFVRQLQLGFASFVLGSASLCAQAFIDPSFSGNSATDTWASLNQATYGSSYGSSVGLSPWSAPITSQQGGSSLSKASGYGYLSSSSSSYIYSAIATDRFNLSRDTVAGTFSITDVNPVADLATVAFQLQVSYVDSIGGFDPTGISPSLTLVFSDSSTLELPASLDLLTYSSSMSSSFGSATLENRLYQWDLSGIEKTVASFSVNYSVVNHSQVYALRVDQSDVFAAVPEPSSFALAALALVVGAVMMRRRRVAGDVA